MSIGHLPRRLVQGTVAPVVPAPSSTFRRVGIALGGERGTYTTADLSGLSDLLGGGGIVRYGTEWDQTQQTAGATLPWVSSPDNNKWDNAVNALQGNGHQVLMVLSNTPSWASGVSTGTSPWLYPPTAGNVTAWSTWVKATVAHWITKGIRAFEIWNESNLGTSTYMTPAVYTTRLLQPAYTAAHQAATEAGVTITVMPCGTSPAGTSGGNTSPMDWYRGIYAAGAHGYMDAGAHHPYVFPNDPYYSDGVGEADSNSMTHAKLIHDIMTTNGDGALKVWATEFGYPARPAGGSPWVTYSQLQTYITRTFARWFTDPAFSAWSGPFFWYRDWDQGPNALTDTFQAQGLIAYNRTTKEPAYTQFKTERATYVGAPTSFTGSAASSAVLANPRRGFFQYSETHYRSDSSGYVPLVTADLTAARTGSTTISENGTNITFSGRTVVFRYFYMEKYKVNGSTIDTAFLNLVTADLAAIKAAGCTARLRFAYDDTFQATGPWTSDVNLATVQAHQNQLATIINAYADIVDSVDAGLIGTYGEWFYTSNFTTGTDPNVLTAGDVTNRNAVISNWLSKLDARIFVNLRYIGSRQAFLGSTSPNPGGNAVRLGHHNDAFLADDGNFGTYATHFTFAPQTINQARAYLDGITSIPVQGESANYNPPGSDWAPTGATYGGATTELPNHHFTSLNPQYHPDTLKAWGQSNIDAAQRQLGYRLRLVSGSYTPMAAGQAMPVSVVIANDGYAAPYRQRTLEVVFVNGATVVRRVLSTDIRNLAPNTSTTVSGTVIAPAAGTWTMHLNLPDPSASLDTNPAYSIQLANTTGWDGTTGYNATGQTVTIT